MESNTKDVAKRLCDKEINRDRNQGLYQLSQQSLEKEKGSEQQKLCQLQLMETEKGNRVFTTRLEDGLTTTESSKPVQKDYRGNSEFAQVLHATMQCMWVPGVILPHSQTAGQVPRRPLWTQQPHREP